jgi:PAS domain S-box-containing protein
MAERSPQDGPTVLLAGRGVTEEIIRRVQKALTSVPEVQVVTDLRAVREQLKVLLNNMQSEEQALQDKIIVKLQDYAERLEQARKLGKDKLDALIENAPEGLGVHEIDNQKVIQRVSPSELRLLGFKNKADMVGKPVWKFVVMQETAQRSIDKKISGSMDLKPFVRTYARADGTPIRLVIVDRFITDAGGTVVGICTVIAESALTGA